MTPNTILIIILSISVLSYLFDQLLDYLNLKAQRKDIPVEIADFYDKEKYQKSLEISNDFHSSHLHSVFYFLYSCWCWVALVGWMAYSDL
jgi:STE24 endopeptidase